MLFAKVPLLLLDALLLRVAALPPNPSLPIKSHIIPDWREHFLKSLAVPSMLFRSMYWTSSLLEAMVISAYTFPSNHISALLLKILVINPQSASMIQVTPVFLLGVCMMLSGTLIRIQCYRTLGKLFTFELSIMKNHSLITVGPYAYVRHPSYTGLILNVVGGYTSHLSAGSWVRESGLMQTQVGIVLVILCIAIGIAVVASLLLRMPSEDVILRKQFGREWEQWAWNVPYRIIPFVY